MPSLPLPAIVVEPLSPGQVRPAWPLVRAGNPSLTLDQWLRFGRRNARPEPGAKLRPSGVMVARREPQKHLCGLVCYQKDWDMNAGPVLTAGHFVALDIIDPAPVLDALIGAMEQRAVALGCKAVRSMVYDGQSELSASLITGGHAPEAAMMLKQVTIPAAGG